MQTSMSQVAAPLAAQKTNLHLKARMRQKMNLLSLPLERLKEGLETLLADNPIVEQISNSSTVPLSSLAPQEHNNDSPADHELDFTPGGVKAQRRLASDDGLRDYYLSGLENASNEMPDRSRRDFFFNSQTRHETLAEHLLKQIPFSGISPEDAPLAELIIGSIDEHGYFTGSFKDIMMIHKVDEQHLEKILSEIKRFEPPGCGARTLKECLLAQKGRLRASPLAGIAVRIIENHLEDIASGRRAAVCAALGIDDGELSDAMKEILKLNPKPGRDFEADSKRVAFVYPEVEVVNRNGRAYAIPCGGSWVPHVVYSREFIDLMNDPNADKSVKDYLKSKYSQAQEIVEDVSGRRQLLCKIVQVALDAQPGFLKNGLKGLRPFTLSDVAKDLDVGASTVSRAIHEKYARTMHGLIPLRSLFTRGGVSAEDGSSVSRQSVINRMRELVAAENPPGSLSDEKLVKILNGEGFNIKRRSVAKYRMIGNIPSSSERRNG